MDADSMESITQQIYTAHTGLLSKGLALSQLPTIHEALEGNLPFRFVIYYFRRKMFFFFFFFTKSTFAVYTRKKSQIVKAFFVFYLCFVA
jgi:hypothetical protein